AKNADLWLIDVSGTLQAGILPYARLSSFPAGCGANLFVTAIGSSLTCTQPAFSNLSGTASDTQLANAYSGVGSCSANNWITALSRNASPSCAQPAFSNLSGLIAIGQTVLTTRGDILTVNSTPAMARLGLGSSNLYPKSNGSDLVYSNLAAGGVGSCSSNNWVNALNADAAPTCAQPAFSNLSGQATTGQITAGSNGQCLTTASSAATWGACNSGGTTLLANGTASLGTSAIGSGACASAVTVSASGVATTDNIMADFNADPTGVTGYAPSASG